jgi:Flp pilus assembly protein TadD
MGMALMKTGQAGKAAEYLQRAIQLEPDHAPAHNNLGKALLEVGDNATAIEELKTAHTLAPDDVEFADDLARALASNGRLPEAIELLGQTVKSHPGLAAEQNNLGILLYQAGDMQGATEHLRRFLQLSPENPTAYCNLANAVAAQGKFAEAINLCDQAINLVRPTGDEATAKQIEQLRENLRAKAGSTGSGTPTSN